ncbi:restriction endonuclease subunit S [Vibrio campbellii]
MVNSEGILGDYVKVQGGYAYKSSDFKGEQACKVIKIKNVRFGYVDYSDTAYICEGLADKTKNWMTREGDVLISMTGSGPNAPQSLVGRVARIWSNEEPVWINQRVGRLVLKSNDNPIDMDFVYYLLSQKTSQDFLVSNSSGSANQANISGKTIELLPFPKVTFEESKQISSILKALDDKILLNKKINQTLEQMAQTLFKSWFVDFDPVIDNALDAGNAIPEVFETRVERRKAVRKSADFKPLPDDVRQLFPNEFEESELGWVPIGWETVSLAEITTELRRGISPKYVEEGGVQVINQKCIRHHDINFDLCRRNNPELRKIAGREIEVGDVLVNSTGVGTLGRVAQVTQLEEVTVVDSHVTVVRSNGEKCLKYTFGQLMLSNEKRIEALGEGSTGQTELSRKILSEQKVVLPPKHISLVIEPMFSSYADKKAALHRDTNILTKLRDTLLPKLISGELRLDSPEVKKAKALKE